MDLGITERLAPLLEQVKAFIANEIAPLEGEYLAEIANGDRWQFTARQTEIMEGLKAKARDQGLWNFFLTEGEHSSGLSTVEYAYLAEEMGKSHIASEVFNCAAPDTGNMEVLAKYGSEAQQKQWLEPLMAGEIRSAYAMTEPGLPSSDARNISTSAVLEGDEYVINGRKWWSSGLGDPRCKVAIVMGVSDPDGEKHRRHSMIVVPLETPGVDILRSTSVFGYSDGGHGGHAEIDYDVWVPRENLLGELHGGFAIAQARLGPGRIHHAMRLIGMAERAFDLMCERSWTRFPFGKPIADQGVFQDWVAEARMKIEMVRLLVLKTAWLMDTVGNKGAAVEISAIKVAAPEMATWVIDRAIETFGGAGVSQDTPLAELYSTARMLHIADGPDEVHKMSLARRELKRYRPE